MSKGTPGTTVGTSTTSMATIVEIRPALRSPLHLLSSHVMPHRVDLDIKDLVMLYHRGCQSINIVGSRRVCPRVHGYTIEPSPNRLRRSPFAKLGRARDY